MPAVIGGITILGLVQAAPAPAAEPAGRYRAFWVDTFNTALNNHDDIAAVVDRAAAANANTIFAEVRRRGDAWYLNSLEPPPDGVPIAPGFDPLADLIGTAHARGIQVHAWVTIGAIWNRDPRLFPPSSPGHVFNRHGFDPATGQIRTGGDNWLTRTLLPDGGPVSMGGYRIGSEFWIDPGHPDAAGYTVDVLLHLVGHYDLDGLHLDRIRYPELAVAGQSPATGANIGYNETSVARFQARSGLPAGSPPPAPNDPRWSQWRRDQVSGLVRRIFLSALAVKPRLVLSASLIAFGAGPTTEADWPNTEAYWRVYQDWRAWTEEGCLDLAVPMDYKTEHAAAGRAAFDRWSEWTRNHQYRRAALIGQGAFLNAIEGTLRQARRALTPSASGRRVLGIGLYSMASSNAAVTANPYSIPPGQNTPLRPFAELASALTTGWSTDGTTPYEDPAANPVALFGGPARVPKLAWKTHPLVGHLMGIVTDTAGRPVDTGEVTITRISRRPARVGRTSITTQTDGTGFYGGLDLDRGRYRVTVTRPGQPSFTAPRNAKIRRGAVATLNLTIPASP